MTGLLRFTLIWTLAAVGFLALAAWLHLNGHLPDGLVQLWSKAILHVDGPPNFKSSDSIYPPLPLVVTMLVHAAVGAGTVPVPLLVSTATAALIAALWYANMHTKGGFSIALAAAAVLLLATHPFFLVAISEGPELAFLCLGVWIFARGILNLRLSGNAPDMMKVAVGLLIIGLSSSYGLLIALGAMPFLALAARPSVFVSSPIGYVIAIVFPVACAVGSLLFVSAIFDTPLVARGAPRLEAPTLATVAIVLAVASLPALVTAFKVRALPSYTVPLLAAVGSLGVALLFDHHRPFLGEPILAAAPLVAVCAVALRLWPATTSRAPAIIALLLVSWVAAAWVVAQTDRDRIQQWASALQGEEVGTSRDAFSVAAFLQGRDDILVDAERNPDLVAALGSVDGLVVNGAPAYELTLLGGLPRHRYIVVRGDVEAPIVRDRVLRRFPRLRTQPPPGYTVALVQNDWTVLARNETVADPGPQAKQADCVHARSGSPVTGSFADVLSLPTHSPAIRCVPFSID